MKAQVVLPIIASILILSFAFGQEAEAAKGIVKDDSGGGGMGSITVTQGGGGPAPPDPGAPPPANVGDEVNIIANAPGATVGDLVDFTEGTDPDTGASGATINNIDLAGEEITSNPDSDLNIGPDESVVITGGAAINVNIKVTDGYLVVTGGSTINGNINSDGGSFVQIDGSPNINGNIQSNNAQALVLVGNDINGNIDSTNDTFVRIRDNRINGNVNVNGAGSSDVGGNTIT